MNLKHFKKDNKKKQIVWMISLGILLLVTVILIYRTYAIYQESKDFNAIKGSIPDQNYDAMVTFIEVDENGNKKVLDSMPEGKNWTIEVNCNNNATAKWDYENWELKINLLETRTKCKLSFYPYRSPLADYGIEERVVESGTGLYRVTHENANITAGLNAAQKANLQKTEYRYAGVNPNNYVTFNNELWRIIGLVNTPEGQRLKLIRSENIGAYSWDSSTSDVNGGRGVNEWSESDIKTLLNSGAYYNRTSGNCYNAQNNGTISCDFRESGLMEEAKEMIDTVTWNIGSIKESEIESNANKFYELERNNKNGKGCTSGMYCTDAITRTTLWRGMVGLIYSSDHIYATTGGPNTSRMECLESSQAQWQDDKGMEDCKNNSWIRTHFTITPVIRIEQNDSVIYITKESEYATFTNAFIPLNINPVINLKTNIKVISGDGTEENPYILANS